ncbi:MAG: ECF-type sigma factor [Phycisphaerae bacterium]|nr:ECF-type sigma factor [Phycisphaerae bacterium]
MNIDNTAATICLQRLCDGDSAAASDLFPLVYDELRAVAGAIFQRERANHTLQPTALINEVYLRLVDQSQARWNGRAHFVAVAARAMRNLLIDHARRSQAQKRRRPDDPGSSDIFASPDADPLDVLGIHEALEALSALNERQAKIVELRFFGGLETDEIAALLDVSPRTVKGEWRMARAWLQRRLDATRE